MVEVTDVMAAANDAQLGTINSKDHYQGNHRRQRGEHHVQSPPTKTTYYYTYIYIYARKRP